MCSAESSARSSARVGPGTDPVCATHYQTLVSDCEDGALGRVRQVSEIMQKAVFLDRDGVLVRDLGAITRVEQFVLIDGVGDALWLLKRAGYLLVLVTNQAVVARGLLSEEGLRRLHAELQGLLSAGGAPHLDAIYSCPHHPNATLEAFKVACECRKPGAGMLLKAAAEHNIDLSRSHMIGDRQSDVAAGKQAGCRTILVESGAHLAPPIESSHPIPFDASPDYVDADLLSAARRIVSML